MRLLCILWLLEYPFCCCFFFFFNDTATTEIYTLSLHDALPLSTTIAMPCPTPMHIVARPYLTSGRRAISCTSVVRIRAPEAPRGCPRATAPPLGFNLLSSGSIPHS